ncbi:MAG: hypothetical protein K5663_01865 [Clostridiales bacterium]|nr:hypothetical protein [Clostridiales bacterium]
MRRLFLALLIVLCAASAVCETEHSHTWGEYTVTKPATCQLPGEQMRVCSDCGETEYAPIEPSEHSFENWEAVSDAEHARVCSVCGFVQSEAHDKVIDREITLATAENLGKHTLTCSRCGYNYTRLVSIDGTYYAQQGDDILGNGTQYIKIESMSLPSGTTQKLSVAAGAEMSILASSDLSFDVFVNAGTGEFKGIMLTFGQGVLSVGDGKAELEFIRLLPDTGLSVKLQGETSSLSVSAPDCGFQSFFSLKKGGRTFIVREHSAVNGSLISGGMFIFPSGAENVGIVSENAAQPDNALASLTWEYDNSSRRLTAFSSLGMLRLFSASHIIDQGNIDLILDPSDFPWGWCLTLDDVDSGLSYTSPTYSLAGEMTSPGSDAAFAEQSGTEGPLSDLESKADQAEIPDIKMLAFTDTLSYTASRSPLIEVKFLSGKFSVKVSNVPAGLTFERIELTMYYPQRGFKLINQYALDAVFELEAGISRFEVDAVFINDDDEIERVRAGAFGYSAQ